MQRGPMRVARIIACFLLLAFYGCEKGSPPASNSTAPQPTVARKPPATPYAFKEFKLGMTLSEFNKSKPRITYARDEKYEAARFVDTTIGGAKAEGYFLFLDFGKGLQLRTIDLTISKPDFLSANQALLSKFGQPDVSQDIAESNAKGATLTGVRLEWNNGISQIVAESVGEKIDEASIRFRHLGLGEPLMDKSDSSKSKSDI